MTREEAIRILKEPDRVGVNVINANDETASEYNRKSYEALDIAIKVLEQQSCEDAISRQAAIDAAKQYWYKPDIAKALEELPPVTPKPKTGHWIKITPSGIYMCSECEQNVLTGDIDVYHYCHHCGIKMVESQESENKCKKCEYYHNPNYIRCRMCKTESEEEE